MNVTRVHTENGSHVEPYLNPNWDELAKLRWFAAVVTADTGLTVTVHEGGSKEWADGEWRPIPGMYSVQVGRTSVAAFTFDRMWTFLHGVSVGVEQARRAVTS